MQTWDFYHQNPLTAEVLKQHANYDSAARGNTKLVDSMTTVEEMWAMINAIPAPSNMLGGHTILIHRQGYSPFWDDAEWKEKVGGRLMFQLDLTSQANEFISHILMHVIGEQVAHKLGAPGLCCGVRYSKKERKADVHLRVEIWVKDENFQLQLREYFFEVAASVGVNNLERPGNYEWKGLK
jgi:hypothetical protein